MLELKNISFSAESENGEKQILKDVSLKIDDGFVVIANGSVQDEGKKDEILPTLLNAADAACKVLTDAL